MHVETVAAGGQQLAITAGETTPATPLTAGEATPALPAAATPQTDAAKKGATPKEGRWVHHPVSDLWALRAAEGQSGTLQWVPLVASGSRPFPRSRHSFVGVPARGLALLSGYGLMRLVAWCWPEQYVVEGRMFGRDIWAWYYSARGYPRCKRRVHYFATSCHGLWPVLIAEDKKRGGSNKRRCQQLVERDAAIECQSEHVAANFDGGLADERAARKFVLVDEADGRDSDALGRRSRREAIHYVSVARTAAVAPGNVSRSCRVVEGDGLSAVAVRTLMPDEFEVFFSGRGHECRHD